MAAVWEFRATELAARIRSGALSSEETVRAHIDRIESVDAAIRAVVVRRFDEALAEARAVDAHRAAGEPLGPLAGVPVSIKESQDVAGTPSTYGLPSRRGDVAMADDTCVAALRAAGAIVIAKTNVPQLLIYIESDNPLYGRTSNPWDVARTCGGSSGGEAALIAAGGSPLGLGSDIGGSLRVPAAFCGIASLKPTQGRLDDPTRLRVFAGQRTIVSQAGPLARSVADLSLAYDLLCEASPGPRREHIDVRTLRIGYYEHAGTLVASAAVARAVREAAAAFAALGATVVPFDPPRVDDAMDLFFGVLAADGGASAAAFLGEDPRDPRTASLFSVASKPRGYLAVLERALRLGRQNGSADIVRNYGFRDTSHYWKLVEAVDAYRVLFARALDAAEGGPLDVIVAPPCAVPAFPHGAAERLVTAGPYAPLYNVLGFPAGTLPVSRVRPGEEDTRPRSFDRIERAARAADRGSAGLPVGVQLIARPWREDVVLAAMASLEAAAAGGAQTPRTPVTPATPSTA